MAFPPAFIDELVARNPIEDVVGQYVNLKRSGSNLFGLCPFHGEKTASFSVAPEKGIYYCFGCHKGGGPINFMMEIEGLSYPDAVRSLAKRAGMEVPEDEKYQSRYRQQERLWALMKEAGRFFHSQLYAPAGAQCLAYTQGRGMNKSIITRFGVGYAPDSWNALVDAMRKKGYTDQELRDADLVGEKNGRIYDRFRNRLMFPIFDVRGNVIGFGGRVLDDSKPKYLNTRETLIFNKRKNLFGLNYAKKTKQDYMILVEGNVDVISLHQYGFDNAVATMGTSLTEEHAALLSRYTEQAVILYDSDAAGEDATRRAIPMLEKVGIKVKVLKVHDAKDPDEFLHKFGADRFKLLLGESSDRVEYQLNAIRSKYDISQADQKVQYVQEAALLISSLDSSVKREVYGGRVAQIAGVSEEAMKLEVSKAFKRRLAREKRRQEAVDMNIVRRVQPVTRTVQYGNVRSAMAEEAILVYALTDPSLLDISRELKPEHFSVPLFGKVYEQLCGRHGEGLGVSLGTLEELSSEEMSHLTRVAQERQGPINEEAYRDCVRTLLDIQRKKEVSSDEDLLALQDALKKKKGKMT